MAINANDPTTKWGKYHCTGKKLSPKCDGSMSVVRKLELFDDENCIVQCTWLTSECTKEIHYVEMEKGNCGYIRR